MQLTVFVDRTDMATNGESPLRTRLRLWTTSPRPARGPAPSYTREQIADAAIAIADSEGLDAVTMRRVATELGTGAMSLYRYVANKESLIELVADRIERFASVVGAGSGVGLEARGASAALAADDGVGTADPVWGRAVLGEIAAAAGRGVDPVASLRAAVTELEEAGRAAE